MIGVAGWAAARKTQNCEAEAASGHTRRYPPSRVDLRANRTILAARLGRSRPLSTRQPLVASAAGASGRNFKLTAPGAELDVASRKCAWLQSWLHPGSHLRVGRRGSGAEGR